MTQIEMNYTAPKPLGSTFNEARDGKRLAEQAERVFNLMKDGQWRTLRQISAATGDPEASVSARLRGIDGWQGWKKDRRNVGNGLYEYRIYKAGT